jgi:hypothetical protein
MKISKKIKIYTLIYQGQIVYVGQTTYKNLNNRKASGYGNTVPFYKECTIQLIEETDDVSRERYWIDRLRDEGHSLLNKYDGNGLDHKEYVKEYALRENRKEYVKGYLKEYRNNNKEKAKQYMRQYRQKKKSFKNENEKY